MRKSIKLTERQKRRLDKIEMFHVCVLGRLNKLFIN